MRINLRKIRRAPRKGETCVGGAADDDGRGDGDRQCMKAVGIRGVEGGGAELEGRENVIKHASSHRCPPFPSLLPTTTTSGQRPRLSEAIQRASNHLL